MQNNMKSYKAIKISYNNNINSFKTNKIKLKF